MNFRKKHILSTILLALMLLLTINFTTTQVAEEKAAEIKLAIFNYRYSWGSCNIDNETHGDFYSPSKFTMGILNSGTKEFLLEQVNITSIMFGEVCAVTTSSVQVIGNETELPVTLYPEYYWLKNITCKGYTSTTSATIKILVNGEVIDYGIVVRMSAITKDYNKWESWTKYKHYTERSNTNLIRFEGLLIGCILLILWGKKKITKDVRLRSS